MSKIFILTLLCTFYFSCKQAGEQQQSKVDHNDLEYLNLISRQALFAKKAAEEALTRSTFIETKSLAENIVSDNEKILAELNEFSGRHLIELPLDISDRQLQDWKKLVEYKGWNFDNEYLQSSSAITSSQIGLLKKMTKQANDPEIKKIAAALLPVFDDNKKVTVELQHIIDTAHDEDSLENTVTVN